MKEVENQVEKIFIFIYLFIYFFLMGILFLDGCLK